MTAWSRIREPHPLSLWAAAVGRRLEEPAFRLDTAFLETLVPLMRLFAR